MDHETIQRGGKTYVLVEVAEFEKLAGRRSGLPPLPQPDREGNVDAVQHARASIAREIIVRREAAGMTQTELARAAGVRVETINRIENGRHTADTATIAKIDAVLLTRQAVSTRQAGAADRPPRPKNTLVFVTGVEGRSIGKRTLMNTGTDKRFVRRDAKGRIMESDNVGKSLSSDRRTKAKTVSKSGRGDRGTSKRPTRRKK
jgi:transcriptional regulator with XRE-family HTH domain